MSAKPRRKSIALSVYFVYILIMLLLMVAGLSVIWFKLDRYQKGRDSAKAAQAESVSEAPAKEGADDEQAAQRVFTEYAEALTAEDWADAWFSTHPKDPESRESVLSYFKELPGTSAPKLYKAAAYSDEAPVYKIKLGDKDAAIVSLKKTAQAWSVSDMELVYSGEYGINKELPEGLSLTVNGITLDRSKDEGISLFPYNGMKDKLEAPLLWYGYEAEGMLIEPEWEISGDAKYEYSEEDQCYVLLSEDEGGALAAKGQQFFNAYMNYTMSGGEGWKDYRAVKEAIEAGEAEEGAVLPEDPVKQRMNAACALTPGDSIAWSMLYKAYDSTCYGLAYKDHDYGLISTGSPVYWAENCVSIDYSYHAYATLNGQRKDYSGEDQRFRVYFLKKDGAWRIWAFDA